LSHCRMRNLVVFAEESGTQRVWFHLDIALGQLDIAAMHQGSGAHKEHRRK
jgi:hypothetical protein